MERGEVAFWQVDEGWGAVRVPGRPGVGFVHFSQVKGISGYRELFAGEPVEVEWSGDRGQDGCQWLAAWVRPVNRSGHFTGPSIDERPGPETIS